AATIREGHLPEGGGASIREQRLQAPHGCFSSRGGTYQLDILKSRPSSPSSCSASTLSVSASVSGRLPSGAGRSLSSRERTGCRPTDAYSRKTAISFSCLRGSSASSAPSRYTNLGNF